MTASVLLVSSGVGAAVMVGTSWLLLQRIEKQDRVTRRLRQFHGSGTATHDAGGTVRAGSFRIIAAFGNTVARSGLLPAKTLAELSQTLASGGIRSPNALNIFLAGKVLLLLGMPAVAYALVQHFGLTGLVRALSIGVAAVVGLLLPDMIVGKIRKRYLQRVEAGLPDALDMLVICSEAGLGLEPAVERVAEEVFHAHPAVADELRQTANELRVVSDRRIALTGMGTRTGLENLKRLGSTLIQTLQFGTPLSQALRTLSSEMRQEMLIKFEERAARLPVLLTMPMILFILPCVFIIVGGPAVLSVTRRLINPH